MMIRGGRHHQGLFGDITFCDITAQLEVANCDFKLASFSTADYDRGQLKRARAKAVEEGRFGPVDFMIFGYVKF
jgi:hypothetical protein